MVDEPKMSDEDIIKALEVHSNEKFDNCEGCPYLDGDSCEGFIKYSKPYRDVLDLINRQKAEIDILIRKKETLRDEVYELQAENEKLKTELVGMRGAANSYKMHYDNAQAEIKKLEFSNEHWNDYEVKCRAITEFAERLKEEKFTHKNFGELVYVEGIDNLVKEMVGE